MGGGLSAWRSVGGDVEQAGVVTFHRLSDTSTRVMIQIDWQPSGVVEKIGSAVNVDELQVKRDAERFKKFIESQSQATGSWRGDIEAG